MKTMYILSGPPASGKSTFVREHGLENYTVSRDALRLLMGGVHETLDGQSLCSPARIEKQITAMLEQALNSRMDLGQTVVIDVTALNAKAQKPYVDLARRWGYRVIVIDFTIDGPSVDELLARNSARPDLTRVPEGVIRSMVERNTPVKHHPDVDAVISPAQFRETLRVKHRDLSGKRVVVVGDVQGCADPLVELESELGSDDDNTVWVFTGDLFDRGLQNGEVANWLVAKHAQGQVILVEGNHDSHVLRGLLQGVNAVPRSTRATFEQFDASGVNAEKLLAVLLGSMDTVLSFSHSGNRYLATHGGVMDAGARDGDDLLCGMLSARSFIYGTGSREKAHRGVGDYEFDIDAAWEAKQLTLPESERITQFHGHRNSHKHGVDAFRYIVNLESEVEHGGFLSYVVIEADGSSHRGVIDNS